MIYDSNDAGILFLPEKKIGVFKYSEHIKGKAESIRRSGMQPTNSAYKKRKMSAWEKKVTIFVLVFYFVGIPGAIIAAEYIESPIIYLLLTPIFIAFPIVACIMAFMNHRRILKYQKCSAVCIGYLHTIFTGSRKVNASSTPLYRLETVNGPLFVYCSFSKLFSRFPEIGESKVLYISDKGPEECYDDVGMDGIIISFITLGICILFNFIVMLTKIF